MDVQIPLWDAGHLLRVPPAPLELGLLIMRSRLCTLAGAPGGASAMSLGHHVRTRVVGLCPILAHIHFLK